MMMSQTNGDGKLDWAQKTQIYAALSLCEDVAQVSEALQAQGVEVTPRQLRAYQRSSAHRIQQMKESGLASHLGGQLARHMSRVRQMDQLAGYVQETLIDPEMIATQAKEFAPILQRYRELMQVIKDYDSPDQPKGQAQAANGEEQGHVRTCLSLLELISDGEDPQPGFAELLSDATRRVAAASGASLPLPVPDQPTLE